MVHVLIHLSSRRPTGRDRFTVLHELNRLRHAKSTSRRKRVAALAGFATIAVSGITIYMCGIVSPLPFAQVLVSVLAKIPDLHRIICDVISLVRLASPDAGKDNLRIGLLVATLVGRSVALGGQCVLLAWCRYARRANLLHRLGLLLALLAFGLHLSLSCLNFLLVVVWRTSDTAGRSVRLRCHWGIDLLWKMGDSGQLCPMATESSPSGDQVPWVAASCMRVLVVVIIGVSIFAF